MRLHTKPGSALVIATLVAMLLATAATGLLMQAQSARAASGEAVRFTRARLEAQALLAEALVRLDTGDPMPSRGAVLATSSGGKVLRQDAAGLVDINAASPEHLASLLVALHIDPDQAVELADRVADWRDSDDLKRLHGAEAQDYIAAHLPPPRNAPFVTESELRAVLGFTPALVDCVAPYLTTYSGADDLDPGAAPDFLRAQFGLGAGAQNVGGQFGRVIILSSEAPLSSHAFVRIRAWVRLTGDARRPFVIHRAAQDLVPADGDRAPTQCEAAPNA
ncbi:MAG: hypothetical protein ABUS48_01355 [Pseudomonadota bacterium]